MERVVKYIGICILIVTSIFGSTQAKAAEKWKCEQVYINTPSIKAYITNGNADNSQWENYTYTATIGDKALSAVTGSGINSETEGTEYTFAVDISKSVSKQYMKEIRKALSLARQSMGPMDRCVLYAFDSKVVQLLTGTESIDDSLAIIASLKSSKKRTSRVYDTIGQMVDRANQKVGQDPYRKVTFVITDGQDEYKGGYSYDAILGKVKNSTSPIYGIGISSGEKTWLDQFSQICWKTNGRVRMPSRKNIASFLLEEIAAVKNTYVVEFSSENNLVTNATQSFVVEGHQGDILNRASKRVKDNSWQQDAVVPTIVDEKIEQTSGNSIRFYFSELVEGADDMDNYIVNKKGEKNLEIQSVSYDNINNSCEIVFTDKLFTGTYYIKYQNITDISMEHNALDIQKIKFHFDGKSEKAEKTYKTITDFWWVILIVVILIILLIGYLVIRRRGGIVKYNGKMTFGGNVEHKLSIATPNTKKIVLEIIDRLGKSQEIQWDVDSSLFVGRSDICNIYFDDDKMSRQHFVIETTPIGCYIMNLSETNGTFVNGAKVTDRRILKEGDVITAGREKFVFKRGAGK